MTVYIVFYMYEEKDYMGNSPGRIARIHGAYATDLQAKRERKRLLESQGYAYVYIEELNVIGENHE